MIKTFLLNIINAVVHLTVAENSMKLYGVDLNTGVVCNQLSTLSLLNKYGRGFEIFETDVSPPVK